MPAEPPVRPAFFLRRALTRSHFLTRSLGVLATAGAAGAFLLLGGVIGRGAEREEREEESPGGALPVSVEAVRLLEGYEVERSFVGRVEPSRSSGLGFELGGRLVAVAVDEGDVVRRGDVLARLDTARLEARRAELVARRAQAGAVLDELVAGPRDEVVAAAVAEVAEMEARLRRAGATSRRIAELHRRSAASAQEFDEARYDEEAAAAALEASRARLDELEAGTRAEQVEAQRASVRQLDAEIASVDLDLEKSALNAPFDGTIAERLIDEGEVIETGRPVVRLMETGRLEVHVGVAADAVDAVAVGERRTLRIDDCPFEAEVVSIRPDRRDRTRAVTVRLALVGGADGLRTGDLATLSLARTVPEPGVWVPVRALSEGVRGLWTCYVAAPGVLTDEHVVERRDLEVLHVDTDRAYVRGTLDDGELVIVAGAHRVVPGMAVRVVENAEAEVGGEVVR